MRTRVQSHIIRSIGYNPETKELDVEFLARQNEPLRRIYRYKNVSQQVFDSFMGTNLTGEDKQNHSFMRYYSTFIRPNYECTRIDEASNEEEK